MIRSSASLCIPSSDIFPAISLIQIDCKDTFKHSFDAEFYALQACVILLERFDFKTVENSQIKRSSVLIWIHNPNIFQILSLIQFHCKEAFNYSFDAKFDALKACITELQRIDLETVENSHRIRLSASLCIPTSNIFPVFSLIQIHCKKTFDKSFDAEFYGVQACVIWLERFDFETVENSKSKERVFWFVFQPQIFFQFFPSFKSIAKRLSTIHSMQNFMLYNPV